jgi:hypothetical protein
VLKIKKARPSTAPFPFHRLSPDPAKPITLHVRHLYTAKGYIDATFTRKPVAGEGYEFVMALRDQELADIAQFAAVSWDNAIGDDDKPVECNAENVLATLKAALENGYDDEIESLRTFVRYQHNFREPVAGSADLGKE